jgi:SAM-dependent methyltransferase
LAETQTSSSSPQAGRAPLDLTKFAEGLQLDPDGVWRGRSAEPVSYPAEGNNACFALEDSSFWFAHRNACLLALLRRFPTAGPFFDIGGGNGFVAAAIQSAGVPVVLVEAGADGVHHAQARGLRNVVHSTLKEAGFRAGSLPAIGFFDVLDHIDDEQTFLREISRCFAADGRIYLTVPAGCWLWSDDDVQAGHFRRYTCSSLRGALDRAGFRPLFVSKMFSPLPLPLFLCRSLPSLFGRRRGCPPGATPACTGQGSGRSWIVSGNGNRPGWPAGGAFLAARLALLWPNSYLPPMTDPIRHSQLSVVIPVYRSEAALPTLVQRLQPVLAALAGEYELVLVNDGSPDRSWEVIEQPAAQHGWVR